MNISHSSINHKGETVQSIVSGLYCKMSV